MKRAWLEALGVLTWLLTAAAPVYAVDPCLGSNHEPHPDG